MIKYMYVARTIKDTYNAFAIGSYCAGLVQHSNTLMQVLRVTHQQTNYYCGVADTLYLVNSPVKG